MTQFIGGYPVIGDDLVASGKPGEFGTGYQQRDYAAFPENCLGMADHAPIKRIPMKEWPELIRYKKEKKLWITDKCDAMGLSVKNQKSTSYCWIFAPTHGMEIRYILMGNKKLILSPSYAGSIIKGGRNQGGSGIVGIKFLAERGTCTQEYHGETLQTRNITPEAHGNAEHHKITSYDDMDYRDDELIGSYILADYPVTVGIPAWWHEVLLTEIVHDGRRHHFVFDNSWSTSFGKNGRGVLSGAKERFSEAGAIRSVTPSLV